MPDVVDGGSAGPDEAPHEVVRDLELPRDAAAGARPGAGLGGAAHGAALGHQGVVDHLLRLRQVPDDRHRAQLLAGLVVDLHLDVEGAQAARKRMENVRYPWKSIGFAPKNHRNPSISRFQASPRSLGAAVPPDLLHGLAPAANQGADLHLK